MPRICTKASLPNLMLPVWLVMALFLSSCEPPARPVANNEGEEPAAAPFESVEPLSPPSESRPESVPKPESTRAPEIEPDKAKPEPPLVPDSVDPVLDVKETGKKIVVSGYFSSGYQVMDIIDALSQNFADYEIESIIDVGDHVKPVTGWGNRIAALLVPLVGSAEDARFHFEAGVITLEGTVDNQVMVTNLQKLTVDVMSDYDSKGIENKLQVKE